MTKGMIERIARALCSHDELPENTKHEGKPMWMDYIPAAHAVIAAMREPTDAMLAAISAAESTQPDSDAIWKAAIDAILDEQP